MAFDESADLAGMFSTSDFAVEASFKGADFNVIFDADYVDVLGVGSSGPMATCQSSDVSEARQGEAIEIAGALYTIKGPPEPDGTGVTVLRLSKT